MVGTASTHYLQVSCTHSGAYLTASHHFPMQIDEGNMVGMISIKDVVHVMLKEHRCAFHSSCFESVNLWSPAAWSSALRC